MDTNLKASLWQQFGASIDSLADATRACPDHLWRASLWHDPTAKPERTQAWFIVYHTLFWLDLYLTGADEGYVPCFFTLIEQDDDDPIPDRPYTKAELLAYLDQGRSKCRAAIESLTDESAQKPCRFGWGELSFLELLHYNLRHIQEHADQLNLLLGQHISPQPDDVAHAKIVVAARRSQRHPAWISA